MHNTNFYFGDGPNFGGGRGRGFGRDGRDGRGFGPGPGRGRGGRARRGDLRNIILALLAEKPMHGYEIITTISERTNGHWEPSAGAIYPQISQLEDEGLLVTETIDGKKVASLTDAGKADAEENKEARAGLLDAYSQPEGDGEHGEDERWGAWGGRGRGRGRGWGFGSGHEQAFAIKRLFEAIRATDPEKSEQLGEILERAAKEIEEL